jgi:hypothetical protein
MNRTPSNPIEDPNQRRKLAAALLCLVLLSIEATGVYTSSYYNKTPYHTSALKGSEWVHELIKGHPGRIYHELGMRKSVFLKFVEELREAGMTDSRYVLLEEKAAIFLYMSVTGLRIGHVGERFQHAANTISGYFCDVLNTVTSPQFYHKFVCLPRVDDPLSPHISQDPKRYPYFRNCLGALDRTHIDACPAAEDRDSARNRKGRITQNTLAATCLLVPLMSSNIRVPHMLIGSIDVASSDIVP